MENKKTTSVLLGAKSVDIKSWRPGAEHKEIGSVKEEDQYRRKTEQLKRLRAGQRRKDEELKKQGIKITNEWKKLRSNTEEVEQRRKAEELKKQGIKMTNEWKKLRSNTEELNMEEQWRKAEELKKQGIKMTNELKKLRSNTEELNMEGQRRKAEELKKQGIKMTNEWKKLRSNTEEIKLAIPPGHNKIAVLEFRLTVGTYSGTEPAGDVHKRLSAQRPSALVAATTNQRGTRDMLIFHAS
ncbi:hypothetical protein U9M48_027189 [Paspalum notatum var. saurae]|uniref:Uncharacterized protein n=1 Tax=Paspalum notatum var. saurae TaxID=547442 RepID=A0AAQ3WZ59_PASNO